MSRHIMSIIPSYLKFARPIILTALAGIMLSNIAHAEVITVDIDLTGASAGSSPIVPPAKVPQSMFLSGAREIYGNSSEISGFNSKGSFREIYPGINMACYSDAHQFEYAFLLKAGADPAQIRFRIENINTVGSTDQGNIIYSRDDCEIYQHAPKAVYLGENGAKPTHSSVMMSGNGSSSISAYDFFDVNRDKMNGSRFNIIPGDTVFGPNYDFYMSKFETTNEQLIKFLNSAESNQRNELGANMFFDGSGNIWINPDMHPQRDEMFDINKSKILYDPDRVVGDRYYHFLDDNNKEIYAEHPATGLSWYGAVKYSNWLTLRSGRGISELCYSEGTNMGRWVLRCRRTRSLA